MNISIGIRVLTIYIYVCTYVECKQNVFDLKQ